MELPPLVDRNELARTNHVCHVSVEGMARKACAEQVESTVREMEGTSRVKVGGYMYLAMRSLKSVHVFAFTYVGCA